MPFVSRSHGGQSGAIKEALHHHAKANEQTAKKQYIHGRAVHMERHPQQESDLTHLKRQKAIAAKEQKNTKSPLFQRLFKIFKGNDSPQFKEKSHKARDKHEGHKIGRSGVEKQAKSVASLSYDINNRSCAEAKTISQEPVRYLTWVDLRPNKATRGFTSATPLSSYSEAQKQGIGDYKYTSLMFDISEQGASLNCNLRHYPTAVYGVSMPQFELITLARQKFKMDNMTTIANYNKKLGIVHYARYQENPRFVLHRFCDHIEKSKDGKLGLLVDDSVNPMIKQWADFLSCNWEKLDPILRLKTLIAREPDDKDKQRQLIKEFVIKNTGDACLSDELIDFLVLILNEKNIEDTSSFYKELDKLPKLSTANMNDLSEMFVKHFFRNSSKLGLKFFSENNVDIAFAWNDGRNNMLEISNIIDKPWNRNERRFQTSYEPITYSEIRYVLRNPDLFGNNVSKVYLPSGGRSVKVAAPLTSDAWSEEKRQ